MNTKPVHLFILFGWLFVLNSHSQSLYLSVNGNSEQENKILDSLNYQKTFKDFSSLQNELAFIAQKLANIGYIENEFVGLNKKNDSLFYGTYILNEQYKILRLYFDISLNRNIINSIFDNPSANYADIDISKLEETLQILNSEISNQGDPFSNLQLTNIKKENGNRLYAKLFVSEEVQQRTIDSIIIKGYENFPKSFVRRYLGIKSKQPFNLKTIKEKTLELENLIFAGQIKDPEVLFTKDSTLLYLYIEKLKSNAFEGFLGFGTNTETSNIEFNGYLNLNLTNNLNYGESFRLIYKSDESEQSNFDVNIKLPYLLGSPAGLELGLNIFKKDSSYVTVSQIANLEYQINPKNLISIGIDSKSSTNLLKNTSLFIDDYKSVFYNVHYLYLKRQRRDVLFPINFRFSALAGFGSRSISESVEPQEKFELYSYKNFNLNDKNSFFISVSGAVINSESYLENELLRFGGINSIRGFEENSLTSNLFSVIATEYRFKLNKGLYVHSVLDVAYYENNIINLKQKLFGFGFGFGLLTKAGLFKFVYSNGKSENQTFKLSDSKIHLSLTSSF